MAKENGLMFLETSAKTAYNVVEAFNLSASCILSNIEKNGGDPNKKILIFIFRILIFISLYLYINYIIIN